MCNVCIFQAWFYARTVLTLSHDHFTAKLLKLDLLETNCSRGQPLDVKSSRGPKKRQVPNKRVVLGVGV